MTELASPIDLMKIALAALDNAGERDAACHLQRAIDAVHKIPPMQPGDTIDPDEIDRMLTSRDASKEYDRG